MVIAFGVEIPETPAMVIELEPPVDDPFIRQELVETAYHVLWELVHVFLEHSERNVHDTGAASFLYPFLGERETDAEAVLEDVRRSILMKAEEIGELRRADADREPRDADRRRRRDARRRAACWRSATAARPPTRWTSWPTCRRSGGRRSTSPTTRRS